MGDVLLAIGLLTVLAFLTCSAIHLYGSATGAARFEASYANANQRIVDCLFWSTRHASRALAAGPTAQRLRRAALAVLLGAIMIALAAYVIVQSDAPALDDEGIAVGAGALIWSCVLEGVGLPERAERVAATPVIDLPLWFSAIILFALDLVLLLVTAADVFGDGPVGAGAVGASFVSLADVTSFAFGLALAAQSAQSPLSDP